MTKDKMVVYYAEVMQDFIEELKDKPMAVDVIMANTIVNVMLGTWKLTNSRAEKSGKDTFTTSEFVQEHIEQLRQCILELNKLLTTVEVMQ